MGSDPITIPFGKWKGFNIEDVPTNYLKWLLETDWFDKKFAILTRQIDDELIYRRKFDIKVEEIK